MNEQEQIDLLAELAEQRKLACLNSVASLYYFYKLCWDLISNEEFIDNWHIRYICDVLQEAGLRVARREVNPFDITINIPPGMSKSTIASQVFPIWLWLQDPSIVVISMSYDKDRAVDNSEKSKIIFKSQRFYEYFQEYFKKQFGHYIRLTKDNEKDWRNNFGGARYCNGIGGATGRHAHVIIPDDPMSVSQAESEAHRKRINRFMSRTLPSRKVNKKVTLTVLIMQRLHADDPTQNAIDSGKKIFHICLPAEVSKYVNPPELKEKYVDGLLDPNRLDRETLTKQKQELGTYAYSGQYDQTPSPEGGGKIKGDWFCYMDESEVPIGIVWDLWLDGAYTKETKNDPTGIAIIGHDTANKRMIIKHVTSQMLEMPDVLKSVPKYLIDQSVTGRIWIEPKASGLSIIQMLRGIVKNDVLPIKNHLVQGGKEVRANTAAPKVEASRVYLVRGNWNKAFVEQVCSFPSGRHDEYIDLLGYSCYHYLIRQSDDDFDVEWD